MTPATPTSINPADTPQAQTQAYLATIPADARARSDAYTEGGHWLVLWGLIVMALVTWIVLRLGWLQTVTAAVNRKKLRPVLASAAVAAVFSLVSWLLTLPWDGYTEWWRPTSYGLSKQPVGDWLMQSALGTLVGAATLAAVAAGIYTLLRKKPRTWWLWGGACSAVFIVLMVLVSPVLIQPLFNEYKPFPQGAVRDEIVKLAQASQVPTDKLLVYDGSRQRNVVTANVAGLFGTARIAVSDIALERATLPEVRAVVAHEIGHYALGHALRSTLFLSLIMLLGLYAVHRLYTPMARRFGCAAAVSNDITNPAGLPVLGFVVALVMLLATPLTNAVTRWGEREADNYSLQTVREPDGLSTALIKTVEYRKATPSALEEWLFYTHPSPEKRVRNAMEWKAANSK